MARKNRVAAAALVAALASSALAIGPANATADPIQYVVSVNEAVAEVTQILASGTEVNGYTWPGTPDGLGGLKNADGTITVFVTHELSASDPFVAAIDRSYGGFGSDIVAIKYNPTSHSIVSAGSAIQSAVWYDYTTGKYTDTPVSPEDAPSMDAYSTPNHTTAINRFCSATLVKAGDLLYKSAKRVKYFVKAKNGKKVAKYKTVYTTFGAKAPVFMTNEEGSDESRVFGLNTGTKELVQLPDLGLGSFENTNIAPASATKKQTVVMIGEDGDSTDSQLYMYLGTKRAKGTWYERAGLTGGARYVASVLNSGADITSDIKARTALAKVGISSVVRGFTVNASNLAITEGQVTITTAAAHNLKLGDEITLSGFDLAALNGPVTVEAVPSTTTFTFGADLDNVASGAIANGLVTLPTGRLIVTTAAVHGLNEGDTVNLEGVDGITGKFEVTGTPTTTVFTVTSAGSAITLGAGGTANKVLDVTFKKVRTDLAGDAQNALARLRGTEFARVEDGQFNPANPNEFYFVTTQSDSEVSGTGPVGVKDASRDGGAIWKLTYANVANPLAGATLELVLDGTEAPYNDSAIKINKPDNISLTANGQYLMIQEDPGAHDQLSRLLALRLSDRKLAAVAQFDSTYFDPTSNSYITNDEETSGIIDATSLLAASGDTASYFLFDAQVHPMTKAGGVSYGSDYQKARAVGLMRPDLIAQEDVSVSSAVAEGANGSRKLVLTLSGVQANGNNDGFVVTATGSTLDVNDTITLRGLTTATNGTYIVSSVDVANSKVKVSVADSITAGAISAIGDAHIVLANSDADLALKKAIVEGGALYTLKIANWDDLFNQVG